MFARNHIGADLNMSFWTSSDHRVFGQHAYFLGAPGPSISERISLRVMGCVEYIECVFNLTVPSLGCM